jgi:hypothetical protein
MAEVEGGGAARAVTAAPLTLANTVDSGTPPVFGAQAFGVEAYGAGGMPDVLAGDHPALLSNTVDYSTLVDHKVPATNGLGYPAVQEPKTTIVDLPAGFVADPRAAAQCTQASLVGSSEPHGRCPAASVVGEVTVEQGTEANNPQLIYNIVPEAGYPALFGFEFEGALFYLRPRVLPSVGGYVLSVAVPDVTRSTNVKVTGVSIMFFGDPTVHDGVGNGLALFSDPDDCGSGPESARLEMDSWVDPQRWVSAEAPAFEAGAGQAVTGCAALAFEPSIEVQPEQTTADTPSGYEVKLKLPQTPNVPGFLATPDLKNAVVRLPAGVAISPSAANGLTGCQASGPEGIELGNHDKIDADQIASEAGAKVGEPVQEGEEMGADGLVHAAHGHCPLASQIGEVEVETPLLEAPLKGHVYVAEPSCGGDGQPACTEAMAADGELYGLYVEVEGSGVIVKLKGTVSANPVTGQLTTTFSEAPQLPFSELKLRLNGGPRAPLANPQTCGPVTATSDLTPWSTPQTPDATPSWPLTITGCGGGFSPAFTGGTVSPAAGAYSPFTLTFSRHDGEQDLSGLTVHMPEGLIGKIAGFTQCAEAQANAGTCPASSRVGTATAAAGSGSAPFWQSGPVYLTGPYNGAPFGLAVVVPANAGPFHLGNIVVRAAIHINPTTAAVTVVSNPLPQMIDGVPLRVQTVNVTVGGEGTPFTFNPTSCNEQSINATITSAQGTAVPVSTPFGIQGCKQLPFKPTFTVSTQGQTSRGNGASLDVRIATKQGPDQGVAEEANIRKVDTQLPIALPSRLSTLQKACTEKQFASNPAGCPEGAFVGTAVARTPLLPVPLEGPAILVSHGGAAFPDLDLVLQGDGVTIDLVGNTNIEHGITYSKFETAPDAPFSSFELKLPEGPHSILGSYVATGGSSFCGFTKYKTVTRKETKKVHGKTKHVTVKVKTKVPAALEMPTTITAQNGAVMTQDTKIAVAGCPTAAAAKAAAAHKAAAKKAELVARRR